MVDKPKAYYAELATMRDRGTGEYSGWEPRISFTPFHVPPAAIRNYAGLYPVRGEMVMCPHCDGSGCGVADTICSSCDGAGGMSQAALDEMVAGVRAVRGTKGSEPPPKRTVRAHDEQVADHYRSGHDATTMLVDDFEDALREAEARGVAAGIERCAAHYDAEAAKWVQCAANAGADASKLKGVIVQTREIAAQLRSIKP